MFAYNPRVTDRSGEIIASGITGAADVNAKSMETLGNNISSALTSIGNMYGKYKDKKDMLAGMDASVGAMSDIGAVTTDFRDKYMNAPDNVRPFLFDAVASPMLKSYTAGQSAAAQAQAWDQYKRNWGSDAGGQPGGGWTVY